MEAEIEQSFFNKINYFKLYSRLKNYLIEINEFKTFTSMFRKVRVNLKFLIRN